MDEWALKTPNPKCRLFFKIYPFTDYATLCVTDFKGIHSWLVFSTQQWTVAPWTKELYLCTVAPLPSLWPPPPPPLRKLNVQYIQTVCGWGGGILNRIRTYKIASSPKQKWPVQTTFLRPWLNMEVDLQSLFGLHVMWCAQLYSLAETPQFPLPLIWARITRALLVSKDRRHLFVTLCNLHNKSRKVDHMFLLLSVELALLIGGHRYCVK